MEFISCHKYSRDQLRGRAIDQLDVASTNMDGRMMFVRQGPVFWVKRRGTVSRYRRLEKTEVRGLYNSQSNRKGC